MWGTNISQFIIEMQKQSSSLNAETLYECEAAAV
jgi:hypothetical protein